LSGAIAAVLAINGAGNSEWWKRGRNMARLLMLLTLVLLPARAAVAEAEYQKVQVADPYLELRTGPGRGYPIFHVVDRGEWVEIHKRRTDWFKIRAVNGKEGWASREQMERTLTEAGVVKTFRDVLYDDYRKRRFEFGFSAGVLEKDELLTGFFGYRLIENLSLELSLARSTGDFSTTNLIYLSVVSYPFPDWQYSPYFSLGLGRFENEPKATLIGAESTSADMANAGLGLRVYITRRFFVRADYRKHVAFLTDDRTDDFDEYSVGLGFFF
jgi:hypothetical protein